jgi:glutathione synthase/RimK-type ligase-like ATP-grasp enzyme
MYLNRKIALATSFHIPNGGKDANTLIKTIKNRNMQAKLEIWNDDRVDWKQYDIVLLHTPWDYTSHITTFRRWITELKEHVTFINPTELILWNTNKRYLLDLQNKGVNIPDTVVITKGSELLDQGVNEFPIVVKKLVSAGGRGNWLCQNRQDLAQLYKRRHYMGNHCCCRPMSLPFKQKENTLRSV